MKKSKEGILNEIHKIGSVVGLYEGQSIQDIIDYLYLDEINTKEFISFDFEGNFLCPISYGVYDSRGSKFFRIIDYSTEDEFYKDVLNYLTTNGKMIIATNLEYDIAPFVLREPERFYIKYIGSRILFAFDKQTGSFFTDTMNFIPASVKVLGSSFVSPPITKLEKPKLIEDFIEFDKKLFKLKMNKYREMYDIFREIIKKCNDECWRAIEEYNTTDAKISYLAMNNYRQFIQNELKRKIKFTTPSVAFSYMRSSSLSEANKIHSEMSSYAYRGGRTEVFVYGKVDEVYVYDINSLYPFAMTNNFPTGRIVEEVDISKQGVSFATIYMKKMHIPPLGVFYEPLQRMIFPVGKFSGFFTNVELRFIEDMGIKFDLYETIDLQDIIGIEGEITGGFHYESSSPIFAGKIKKLYELRKYYRDVLNNEGYSNFIKLIMNSSYGKLGLKTKKTTAFDGKTLLDSILVRSPYTIYAAYVTAYGRLTLYNYIQEILDKGGEIFYTDTDSLHTNISLEESKELGKLKLEFHGWGIYMGPKFYMLKNQEKSKVKMKGIPEANEKMFVDLLNSENNNADIESIYTVQKLYGYLRNRLAYIPPTTTYMMAKHVILDNLIKKRIPIKPINKFSDFKNRIDTVPIELKGDICHKKTGLSQNLELEYNKFIYGYD